MIGALKDGGLDVYDLDGQTMQSISPEGARFNNVDVQYGFALGGNSVDLAIATDRYADKLAFFAIDPQTRQLTDVTDPANALIFTERFCSRTRADHLCSAQTQSTLPAKRSLLFPFVYEMDKGEFSE